MNLLPLVILVTSSTVDNYGYDVAHEDWRCMNEMEIHCLNGSCTQKPPSEASGMSIGFNDEGRFSVGAYTGAWVGTGETMQSGPFFVIWKLGVPWSSPTDDKRPTDVIIVFDEKEKIATVHAGGWVQPYSCKSE